MILQGLVHPQVASLIRRVRHTNTLVLADVAFPFWPGIETVDLALTYGVPTIPQVLDLILAEWKCGGIYMAEEFRVHNTPEGQQRYLKHCREVPVHFEPHIELKRRVPAAIGLIRTGETTIYGNMVLVSA